MNYIKTTYSETIAKSDFYRIDSVKFQKHGNTTTCILEVQASPNGWDTLRTLGSSYIGIKTFVGIAKCSDKDTFNEITGKDIAEHRAFKQYYDYLSQVFNTMEKYFLQAADCAMDFKIWAQQRARVRGDLANKY